MAEFKSFTETPWNSYKLLIKTIIIDEYITSIGSYSFSNCDQLTSLRIADTVISIGNNAFSSCIGLTTITFPSCLRSINESAFESYANLQSIRFTNDIISIGKNSFNSCQKLSKIEYLETKEPEYQISSFNECPNLDEALVLSTCSSDSFASLNAAKSLNFVEMMSI